MELSSAFQVLPAEGERPGAYAVFPYDRDLVRRFRETFPRARWRGEEQGWFVPVAYVAGFFVMLLVTGWDPAPAPAALPD